MPIVHHLNVIFFIETFSEAFTMHCIDVTLYRYIFFFRNVDSTRRDNDNTRSVSSFQ